MDPLAQARALFSAGHLREASAALSEILRKSPSNASAMQLLAVIQFQSGFRREAFKLAERAVSVDPNNAEAWNNLGLMHHLSGDESAALTAFENATRFAPEYREAWRNLGFIQQGAALHEEALNSFSRAGDGPDVQFFAGNSLSALGRYEEALVRFDALLALDPNNGDVWHNRANALAGLGRIGESLESFAEAIHRLGRSSDAHCNLAVVLRRGGRLDEGLTVLKQVRQWDPSFVRAKDLAEQFEAELRDLELRATRSDLEPTDRCSLAKHLQLQGKWHLAIDALATETSAAGRFLEGLLLPAIFESDHEPEEALAHISGRVERLLNAPPHLEDPLRDVGITMFHLPYFGVSERPIQEAVAKLYRESSPDLRFEAGHGVREGRKRIGVLAETLRENTIARVFGGLIERLDKDRFELVYLQLGPSDAWTQKIVEAADRHVNLSPSLAEARQEVAREEVDILFYPEIGLDPQTYYLAFSRLAPIQATTWGHPLTTGSPVMDYFISSEHFERQDGQNEYTEQLITLQTIPMYYGRLQPPPPRERDDFGLPENKRLYGCLQMAYKFHPAYDRVLAEILERDDKGMLVLIEPQHSHYKEILLQRWSKFPSMQDRILWQPQMSLVYYLALVPLCDALLAPVQFGGGRSTLDAFAMGCPVVTYQGDYLKSRITHGAYRQIGVEGLTASTEDEYVDIALHLAQDVDWRGEKRREIAQQSGPLFESGKAVAEFNDCLANLTPRP